MGNIDKVTAFLDKINIKYTLHNHPSLATIEDVLKYRGNIPGEHCKNLFFRNHKGDRHYLVLLKCTRQLNVHDLEKNLKQGKLTFASKERMLKYLGLEPGSVSPFGLINDSEHHVKLFIDKDLDQTDIICFHPNDNRASVSIKWDDFILFLNFCGNEYDFVIVDENSQLKIGC